MQTQAAVVGRDLVGVVEDVAAQLPVQELVEVGHEVLGLHCPLPRRVDALQLVAQVTHLRRHVADVFIQLLEVLEGHLRGEEEAANQQSAEEGGRDACGRLRGLRLAHKTDGTHTEKPQGKCTTPQTSMKALCMLSGAVMSHLSTYLLCMYLYWTFMKGGWTEKWTSYVILDLRLVLFQNF